MHNGSCSYEDPLTALRLQLLANGYVPIPNRDKVPGFKGWSRITVNEATIRSWKGSRALRRLATGLRVESELCVIDVDSNDPRLANGVREDLSSIAPEVAG